MPNLAEIQTFALNAPQTVIGWATSPQFYAQIAAILICVLLVQFIAIQIPFP